MSQFGLSRFSGVLFVCLCLSVVDAQETAVSARSGLNWNTQLVQSTLSLDVAQSGIQLPSGRNAALQMLEMNMPELLKDPWFSIIVDSSQKLGNAVTGGQIPLTELTRVIEQAKKTPPSFSLDLTRITMAHTALLPQIGSLFIKHTTVYRVKPPLKTTPSRAFTGIVIDARGALPVHGEYGPEPLKPCLFPRLWSADMELLYDKSMVAPDRARQKGIVKYTASLDDNDYRDWIGNDPLHLTAREVYGTYRTDPVISASDYLKILSIPENRELLVQGKVVIICNPDELEIANLGPVKDEDYYFIRRDINRYFEQHSVTRIDFTDTWEGLKLTIYDIRFIADTARILPEERARLDGIADALKLVPLKARFMVEGHTASIGKPSGELTLSQQRAAKIAEELIARGITAERIDSAGYGGTHPLANNDTDEGRAKNRRVEITIKLD